MAARESTRGGGGRRLLAETKHALKTTEFWMALLAIVAILVAGTLVDAGDGQADVFNADRVWLYVTIIVAAYLISRGLAKAGSPASESQGSDGGDSAPVTERLKAAAHAFQEGPEGHGQQQGQHQGTGLAPGDHQGVR